MRISDLLSYLFCPPRCASCGELIGLDFLSSPLCKRCMERLSEEEKAVCRKCNKQMKSCTCSEDSVMKVGCLFHSKLALYHGGLLDKAVNGIVFEMKRSSDKRLYSFLADRIVGSSKNVIDRARALCGAEKVVFTYVPRSDSALIKYGHDQAELLARAIAERYSSEVVRMADRRRGANGKMKSLSYEDRFTEAEASYVQSSEASSVKDAFVIIVDDVVTSGASVVSLARMAMKNKARGFGVISVGISK